MRKLLSLIAWVVVLVLGMGPPVVQGAMMTLFSSGFESPTFESPMKGAGTWLPQQSTLSAHTGGRGANVQGPTVATGDLLIVPVSTVGYRRVTVSAALKWREGLEVGDSFFVDFSTDGGEWSNLETYAGPIPSGDWQMMIWPFAESANDSVFFALRFGLIANSAGDRVNLDDLVVQAEPVPEPTGLLALLWLLAAPVFIKRCRRA